MSHMLQLLTRVSMHGCGHLPLHLTFPSVLSGVGTSVQQKDDTMETAGEEPLMPEASAGSHVHRAGMVMLSHM